MGERRGRGGERWWKERSALLRTSRSKKLIVTLTYTVLSSDRLNGADGSEVARVQETEGQKSELT
jgi:hypothetical protein